MLGTAQRCPEMWPLWLTCAERSVLALQLRDIKMVFWRYQMADVHHRRRSGSMGCGSSEWVSVGVLDENNGAQLRGLLDQ